MLEKICKKYLQFKLKKYDHIEMVIRNDGSTFRKRDKEREEAIDDFAKKMKSEEDE